jgi:hypothetical protein
MAKKQDPPEKKPKLDTSNWEQSSLDSLALYNKGYSPLKVGEASRPLTEAEKEMYKDQKTGISPITMTYKINNPKAWGYFGNYPKPVGVQKKVEQVSSVVPPSITAPTSIVKEDIKGLWMPSGKFMLKKDFIDEFTESAWRKASGQSQLVEKKQYGKGGPKPGELYNTDRANELGYTFDELGHLPSVDSETGMWLKSKEHPTAWKELNAYALNLDLQRQLKHPVVNPEGYFGDNQLQYNAKEQYATGGLINNNNNNMINKYKGDSHFDPSGGIGLSTAIVEDGELEYKGYIFSKDSEEKKKLEKEQALRAIRTNKDDNYVSDKISRDSLNRAAIPLVESHEANRINKLMADLEMAEQGLAEAGIAPQEDMSLDPSQMDQLPIMAAGGLAPRITTNQQYDNNLGLDSPTLDTSGFNNRFASSSNFRPDARFSPEFNQPSVSTLAKPSLSSALNTQPSSTESVEPSSNTTLANPNVENKKLGFEAVKSANNSTLNSSFNPSFTPSTDPSLINPQRYKDISVMPKSTASVKDNPVNIDQNANSSWGKAGNAVGYANAGINLGSTLYDTFKTPIEEVNQDVSQDAGYIADMEDIAKKRKDLATGTTVTGAVGAGISAVPVFGTVIGGILAGGAALSQAIGTAALDEEEKTAKKDNTAKVKKRLFIDNRDFGGTEMVSAAPRNRQSMGYGGFKENKQIMAWGGKKRMAEGRFNDVPKIKNYSTRENNPDYTAVPPNDLMGPPMQPQWMNDLSSRPSYSVSGTATGPNTPMSMIGSSGNLPEDKKKVDWGNIAETAGMGLLSNVGNLAYLLGEGKDYDKVNYGSYTPEMVNTSSSRRAIRDSIATSKEALKESGKLDRTSMALLGTQGAKQYADAEERIRLANTGMFNDAQLKNIDINIRQQNDEAMNKGQALTNYYNALGALGQNTQAAGRGYNLRTSDAEKQRLVNENNARLKEWIASLA